MPLIECKDCGNQISDSAASCPKCGAPVPRTIKEGEEQCPHCMTVVSSEATTCMGCGAKKGYATNAYGVMGKTSVIIFGLIVPLLIVLVFPLSAILFVPVMLLVGWRLKTGPRWYTSTVPTR